MEKKVKKVVVSFDFDAILQTPVIGSKREDIKKVEDCLLVEKDVQSWYTETYPADSMGGQITDALSWYDLLELMRQGRDIYSVLGVTDSLVRERVMGKLAKLLNVPYDAVYRLWLRDEGYTLYGEYDDGRCVREERYVSFKRDAFSNLHDLEAMLGRLTKEEKETVRRMLCGFA